MSILSCLNIKTKIKEALSEEKVSSLLDFIKSKIIEQAQTELAGKEKKTNVDNAVIAFIKTNIVTTNPFISMLINILIDYVPVFTQCIYDYLKKYTDGLNGV